MKMDLSLYEMSLRQTERDLGALDDEQARIKQEIQDRQTQLRELAAKRIEWLQLSAQLKKTLGLELNEDEKKVVRGAPTAGERLVTITPTTFQGMTIADAARKYLLMVGRAASTREFITTLPAGGVMTDAKHLDAAIRNALARRPDWFVFFRDKGHLGMWELAEWQTGQPITTTGRPAAVPPKSPISSDEPKAAQQAA